MGDCGDFRWSGGASVRAWHWGGDFRWSVGELSERVTLRLPSCYVLMWWDDTLLLLLIRALIPHGGSSSWPHLTPVTSQKPHFLTPLCWGFRLQCMNSGVEDTIQSIAGSFCRVLNSKKIDFKIFYPLLSQQLPVSIFSNSILDISRGSWRDEPSRALHGAESFLRTPGSLLGDALPVHANLCLPHAAERGDFQLIKFNIVSFKVFLWSYFCELKKNSQQWATWKAVCVPLWLQIRSRGTGFRQC